MRVEVRAVIMIDGRVVVAREQRHGESRLSLPGGRVDKGESVEAALVREVHEETGLDVEIGPLLYVAEVTRSGAIDDLEIVFAAVPRGAFEAGTLTLVRPSERESMTILPPLLGQIADDLRSGWDGGAKWLGNIWRPELVPGQPDLEHE